MSNLNAGIPAIDYLYNEWRDKTVGFVSYGGLAAGTRAVQALKPVFLSLKALPILESVNIPFVASLLDEGALTPNTGLISSATAVLDEIARREGALGPLRHQSVTA
ncbi:NADPH-dependent FMN reductase [Rhodococcus opacus]|uniref:NADPH-dependent FMN reductase n=1 Tax=Rhodococcus opacus TaxID=37919 RepID=UPI00155AB792|nr:NAD(P)H-dependent oxidoreductase [Rhodococcus opacus]